ncbi:MAG: hypothetical protein WD597_02215, partial [Balneolaceae bacterium]
MEYSDDGQYNKWYDNKVDVGHLIYFFFPVGINALWKSQTISKGWKVGWSLIIGFLVIGVWNSDDPHNKQAVQSAINEAEISPKNSKLGVSYNQVMDYLSTDFELEESSTYSGEQRYMGTSSNGVSMLEIIGDKENISKTTILVGFSNNQTANTENLDYFLRFIRAIFPNSKDAADWAVNALIKIRNSPNQPLESYINDKKISLTNYGGLITTTVEPRN